MSIALFVIAACFAAVTVFMGLVGIVLGVPIFGGMPARAPLPPMPEIAPIQPLKGE